MTKSKDCSVDTDLFLQYLNEPEQYPQVQEHIDSCAFCQKALMSLRRAAFAGEADQLTCGECEARLPDYVHAQIMEEGLGPRLSDTKTHLALCPYCSQRYKALLQIDEAVLSGDLETPIVYPSPNLSFLKKKQGDNIREWVTALGKNIVAQIITSPMQPSLAAARRHGHKRKRPLRLYYAAEAQVNIALAIHREGRKPVSVELRGQVIPQEQSPKSGEGTIVGLFYKGAEIDTVKVNAQGNFRFEDVKRGIYEIRICWGQYTICIRDLLV